MQIHIVKQGDTIFNIANTYNTPMNTIIDANELDAPGSLVVGQAIVIPVIGQFYFVQRGDNLNAIAQKFGTTSQELARINNIPMQNRLPVGFQLYIPPQPQPAIVSSAYIEPYGETVSNTLKTATKKISPVLTYLAPFSYTVNRDGSLTAPPLDSFKTIADSNDTTLMLVVTNLENGAFSKELGHIILTVQAVQNKLLDSIVNIASEAMFSDVHFDFEFLPPDDRVAYNTFLRKAKERLTQAGLQLSTALVPKTSGTQQGAWYEAHDYEAHGEIVDFVVLMTYEWGYSAGPPLPVSPLNNVREVVEYALSVMPSEKVLLGQNLYGYDWTLPYVEGGEIADALSPQQAITLARKENVAIEYDQEAQAPFFTYYDAEGNNHQVWFEDARSIQAKFNLIKELGLHGIAYWKLGLAFPQNWLLLQANFSITKRE